MTGIHSSEEIRGQGLIICYTAIAQTRIDVNGICSWNKKINSIFEVVKKRNFQRYEFFDLLIRNQPKNYLLTK